MNRKFDALSAALILVSVVLALRAMAAMVRAWRAGFPSGSGWCGPSPIVPQDARWLMQEAMLRWAYAFAFLLLAGLAAIFVPAPP